MAGPYSSIGPAIRTLKRCPTCLPGRARLFVSPTRDANPMTTGVPGLVAEREARRALTNTELGMLLIEDLHETARRVLGKSLTISYVEGFDPMSVYIDLKRTNYVK